MLKNIRKFAIITILIFTTSCTSILGVKKSNTASFFIEVFTINSVMFTFGAVLGVASLIIDIARKD